MDRKISGFTQRFKRLLLLRSDDYDQYGRYLVQEFTYQNIWLRLIAQLGDIAIMILPIIIWLDVFLLATAGVVSVSFLYMIMTFTLVLILIFVVFANTYCSLLFGGQSFGKVCLRFKAINNDNSQCNRSQIIIREVFGKEVPIIVFYILLGLKGVLLFLIVNGIVVLADKKHRSIIDFFLKTRVVILSPMGMKHRSEDVLPND